jgi:hypothetical protein
MSEFMTEFTADQHPAILIDQPDERSGLFWYLSAVALIALGGVATIFWTAFLGWAAGSLLGLW